MPRRIDLKDQRFGRLVVLCYAGPGSSGADWRCLCDCGREVDVPGVVLRDGRSRSCGCLKRETTIARSTKHGQKPRAGSTPTYQAWQNMIRRCTNPNHPRYADWGGRGITVCDRWHDFQNFLADMGEKPVGTTLERINNDRGYGPDNCCWASHAKQQRNRRGVKLTDGAILEIARLHGQGLMIKDIAAETNIDRHVVGQVCAVVDVFSEAGWKARLPRADSAAAAAVGDGVRVHDGRGARGDRVLVVVPAHVVAAAVLAQLLRQRLHGPGQFGDLVAELLLFAHTGFTPSWPSSALSRLSNSFLICG